MSVDPIDPWAVARLLGEAADHLDKTGLFQLGLIDREQYEAGTPADECRASALYAVAVVLSDDRDANLSGEQAMQFDAARCALRRHLGQDVNRYCNAPDRTTEEVTDALRAAAVRLRVGDLPPCTCHPTPTLTYRIRNGSQTIATIKVPQDEGAALYIDRTDTPDPQPALIGLDFLPNGTVSVGSWADGEQWTTALTLHSR